MKNLFYTKNYKLYFIKYMFVVNILIFFSCSRSNSSKESDNKDDTSNVFVVDKSEKITDEPRIVVRPNSIVFFRINKSEYEDLIMRAGKYSKYDFDVMFDSFEKLSKSTQNVTPSQGIKTLYTFASQIIFVNNNNDTIVFNRVEKDIMVGIALFRNDTLPLVEEGILEGSEVRGIIMNFYNLKNLGNIEYSVSSDSEFEDFSSDSNEIVTKDSVK